MWVRTASSIIGLDDVIGLASKKLQMNVSYSGNFAHVHTVCLLEVNHFHYGVMNGIMALE